MKSSYRQRSIGNRKLSPETLMTSYGYDPFLSEGSVKPPVFLTSTFAFKSAEDGKDFFDYVAGRKTPPNAQDAGLVYSRFNHPNLQIVEERLAVLEGGEGALMFASGMAAITAAILAFARPGDTILHSQPLYGGTETLLVGTLAPFGLKAVGFMDGLDEQVINAAVAQTAGSKVPIIYVESPANPTCGIVDFELMVKAADAIERRQGSRPLIVVDNTMLGPIFQQPLQHGADIIVYSLTKYVGGHSDVLLGSITVNSEKDYEIVRGAASQMGHFAAPDDCWLALRGARTMPVRLQQQEKSGLEVARWFENRPEVLSVLHPALPSHPQHALWKRDFTGACSLFGVVFKPRYTEADIFSFIDSLELFGIGASWGGFESLALPTTGFITRSATSPDLGGFTVRIHIGLEDIGDLVADLTQGLAALPK